jgi:hypothetical protein
MNLTPIAVEPNAVGCGSGFINDFALRWVQS